MQTADFNYEDFDTSQQSKADETLLVKFYYLSVADKAASSEAGRPMFKEVEMIDIKVPGQRDGVARPASPRDKGRFPRHYQAFKNRMEAPSDGTPLSEWPAISRSFADQLSFANVKTVEALADLNDNLMHNIPGVQNYKQKAKDWLEATKDDAVLSQMRDELTARDQTIAEQGETMEQQATMIEKLNKRLDKLEAAEA